VGELSTLDAASQQLHVFLIEIHAVTQGDRVRGHQTATRGVGKRIPRVIFVSFSIFVFIIPVAFRGSPWTGTAFVRGAGKEVTRQREKRLEGSRKLLISLITSILG